MQKIITMEDDYGYGCVSTKISVTFGQEDGDHTRTKLEIKSVAFSNGSAECHFENGVLIIQLYGTFERCALFEICRDIASAVHKEILDGE